VRTENKIETFTVDSNTKLNSNATRNELHESAIICSCPKVCESGKYIYFDDILQFCELFCGVASSACVYIVSHSLLTSIFVSVGELAYFKIFLGKTVNKPAEIYSTKLQKTYTIYCIPDINCVSTIKSSSRHGAGWRNC
jgi:hypothetical protein